MYNRDELNRINEAMANLDIDRLAEVFRVISFAACERFEPHSHRRIEINYIKRGECHMSIGEQRVVFKEGETACIFSHVKHDFQAGPRGCTLIQLEFLPDVFMRYEQFLFNFAAGEHTGNGREYLKIVNDHDIVATVQNIMNELSSDRKYNKMMVLMYYGVLLIHISRQINDIYVLDSNNRVLRSVVTYVHENYNKDISVKEMAAQAEISERYLRRVFARHLDCSPNQYVSKVRIERALQQLSSATNSYSIKEICYMCGFKTPQYFTKVFRQIVGMTPREYLRK